MISALDAVKSKSRDQVLVAAADRRETKAGYFYEMWFGDGGAAVTVGHENVIAEFMGSYSVSYDFVDHYRGAGKAYDYMWEERWTRDQGYSKIIPEAVNGLLDKIGMTMDDVDHLAYPCFFKAEHKKIAKKLGAAPEKVMDNLHEVCGETGAAHSLLMLAAILEKALPNETIIVAGFGQGCDALYFEVTENILNLAKRLAQGMSKLTVSDNRRDDPVPLFDRVSVRQRVANPLAQHPLAHRRHTVLQHAKQASLDCAGPDRLLPLQAAK